MRHVSTMLGASVVLTACGAATMPAAFFVGQVDDGNSLFGGGGVYDGTSVVCLSVDDPEAVEMLDGAWVIDGRAISDAANTEDLSGNLVDCADLAMRVLEVRDASGQLWTLGYSWTTEDGWDRTPAIGIRSGEPVSLTVRADPDSQAAGFVVTSDDQLLYAMESGRGGEGLVAEDLTDLAVTVGNEVTTTTGDCGEERTYTTLDFTSDGDRERLGPNGDGALMVDSEYLTVCNITSFDVTAPGECDVAGETSWMLFR